MTEKYSFGTDPIVCHAFNFNCTEIALSPNNHEVHLFRRAGNKWDLYQVLSEHSQRVNGISWAPKTNKIATVSQDRNAYVWIMENNAWKPSMVLVRINRAATCVSWSPFENKFAVGSGARLISICFFEKEQDWWVGKHIKKPIRSTVSCVDWHPNNCLVAAGSTDFKTRIFSGYVKEVDEKPEATAWGKKMLFANLMAEFSSGIRGGWVQAVSFSADGNSLAWTSHDSSVSVVDATQGQTIATLRHEFLPFNSLTWLSPQSLLAAGHDCTPMLFHFVNGQVQYKQQIEVKTEQKENKLSAMKRFQAFDKKATTDDTSKLETTHQNSITEILIVSGDKSRAQKVSTVGIDGQLVIWNLQTLEQQIAGLRIH